MPQVAAAVGRNRHEEFARDGVVPLRGVVSPQWLDVLRQAAEELRRSGYDTAAPGDAPRSSVFKDNTWALHPDVRRFLFESGIAAVAATVIRSNEIRLYGDIIIYKEPGVVTPTPWHQDEGSWPVAGTQWCSVWFSTEATTMDTGGLRFVAGSHRGPLYTPPYMPEGREHHETFEGGDLPDVSGDPARFPIVRFDTEPGDAIVFHPRMLHAAFGSASDHPRRTFSFRFVGDDIRWKRKQCVYLSDLLDLPLEDGDPLHHDRFPLLWANGSLSPWSA